jgi:hypothetical protein
MKRTVVKSAALASLLALAVPAVSNAGISVGISVGFAPPVIPVYVQPPCPVVGYIWTPGYWSYSADDGDYYWVPGAWVAPPSFGLLWTPGYWGFSDGLYLWHTGYWGPHVGFYGGINYGFGYFGAGFQGGYWRGHDFFYNRSVANVSNISVTNVYNRTVVNNFNSTHVSFNGPNGVEARPSSRELMAAREAHRNVTSAQRSLAQSARSSPGAFAQANHGHPDNLVQHAAARGFKGGEGARAPVAARNEGRISNPSMSHTGAPVPHSANAQAFTARGTAQHNYPVQHYQAPREAPAPHFQAQHVSTPPQHVSAPPRHVSAPPRPAAPHMQSRPLEAHSQGSRVAEPPHESHRRG